MGTVLMLWVLGFMGTVIFLPFLYLRFERESWLLSITLSLGADYFSMVFLVCFKDASLPWDISFKTLWLRGLFGEEGANDKERRSQDNKTFRKKEDLEFDVFVGIPFFWGHNPRNSSTIIER